MTSTDTAKGIETVVIKPADSDRQTNWNNWRNQFAINRIDEGRYAINVHYPRYPVGS